MTRSPSFIRTEKAIIITFIRLLKEKPFEKITVQDILDNTPVTRATFYAHFHDKYEIAEKLQDHFIKTRDSVRQELRVATLAKSSTIQQKSFIENHELVNALLKIHTEKVDIRKIIQEEFEQTYLSSSDTPNKTAEARIYAQARAEFELLVMNDDSSHYTFRNSNDIFLSVALHLLRLEDDHDAREFLEKKLEQKFPSLKK